MAWEPLKLDTAGSRSVFSTMAPKATAPETIVRRNVL